MDKLAIFLTVSLISLIVFKPKEIRDIRIYSFLIPLGLFSLIIIGYASLWGAYYAGQAIVQSILPLIISSSILFWGLKNKSQSEKLKFPVLLLIAMLITWGIDGYTYYLKSKINDFISKSNIAENLINSEPTTSRNKISDEIKYLDADYKNLSIKLPENWNFKPHEVANDNRYQLLCSDKSGFNTFVITEIELLMKLDDLLNFMKVSISNMQHTRIVFSNHMNPDN